MRVSPLRTHQARGGRKDKRPEISCALHSREREDGGKPKRLLYVQTKNFDRYPTRHLENSVLSGNPRRCRRGPASSCQGCTGHKAYPNIQRERGQRGKGDDDHGVESCSQVGTLTGWSIFAVFFLGGMSNELGIGIAGLVDYSSLFSCFWSSHSIVAFALFITSSSPCIPMRSCTSLPVINRDRDKTEETLRLET